MERVEHLEQEGLAVPVPLYVRFKARGFPIVGTNLDYFDFRGLTVDRGRPPALLGECVLGSKMAQQLGLRPGDQVTHVDGVPVNERGCRDMQQRTGFVEYTFLRDSVEQTVRLENTVLLQ